ncbi:hypothetical protein ACROYT_G040803 [Oculina patagonica]
MKGFLLSVIFLSAVLATAYSIKCYVCKGTEDTCSKDKLEGDKTKQQDCPDVDRCLRTWYKKDGNIQVTNRCSTDAACKIAKEACDKIDEGKCAVGCCDKDLCNAGSHASFSVFLMAVCSAVGLALLK